MAQPNNLETFQILATLLVSISKGQHILQCVRQVLTSNPLFNPIQIFKYLTKGNNYLYRKDILNFLQQNNFYVTQQEVGIIFKCYGYQDQILYTFFLNYIYPMNSGIIRQISTTHLKHYKQTQKLPIQEQIIAALFLLLSQQINLIRKLQAQKNDFFVKMPKQKLKKILKSIKKASEKQHTHSQNRDNVITSLELRNFIKAFIDVGDYQFLHLGRKLNMDKNGIISLEELQFWIKPWKKVNKTVSCTPTKYKNQQKQFNQLQYRQLLSKEIAQNSNSIDNNSYLKAIDYNNINKQSIHKGQTIKKFKLFLDTLLSDNKDLQVLKNKFNTQLKPNMISLFKKIDKEQKGTISSQDIRKFYYLIGGIQLNVDFTLLAQKYSHSYDNLLTFTQFCQIFNSHEYHQVLFDNQNSYISQECYRVTCQILNLTLECENKLKNIRKKFNKGEGQELFYIINKQKSGFINYQQMKRFVCGLDKKLTMQQLMTILKALDKSKNGVVIEKQFVNYFESYIK